jgi:protocatechuate 3,4-dioxygenase beta subunit
MERKQFLKSLGMSSFILPLVSSCAKDSEVTPTPSITGFTPSSGAAGTTMVITGLNFSAIASSNAVAFNGTAATVTSATSTQLTVTVPAGATSGAITVTVNNKTGTSTSAYAVTAAAACASTSSETEGPFPTKTPSSLVMTDIRADRTGVALTVTITIQNKNNGCAALEGALVDIWHCDKDGYYSEYGGTSMQSIDYTSVNFLRGRQITNSNGQVAFTSIFPGWYQSRATHIHVHVYNAAGTSLLVTQIAFPEGTDSAVSLVNASTANGYTKGMTGYTYNANDNVFSDSVANEMGSISGSIANGYALTFTAVVSA